MQCKRINNGGDGVLAARFVFTHISREKSDRAGTKCNARYEILCIVKKGGKKATGAEPSSANGKAPLVFSCLCERRWKKFSVWTFANLYLNNTQLKLVISFAAKFWHNIVAILRHYRGNCWELWWLEIIWKYGASMRSVGEKAGDSVCVLKNISEPFHLAYMEMSLFWLQ